MGAILLSLLAIFISLVVYLISKAKKINSYWVERGIPHLKPHVFVGNSLNVLLQKTTIPEVHKEIYHAFPKDSYVGVYDFMRTKIMLKDPEVIEKVLIKDFGHFVDRAVFNTDKANPLDTNLFNTTGNKWRAMRYKLAPIFTTGKMKSMVSQMVVIGDNLIKVLEKQTKRVELKEVLNRFAMDIIGSSAFGIEVNSLQNPDSEFAHYGKDIFNFNVKRFFQFFIATNFPQIAHLLKMHFIPKEIRNYFTNLLRKIIKDRTETRIQRNDFIELMLQLKEKGHMEIQNKDPNDDYLLIESDAPNVISFEVTEDLLIGQAFVFLTAGFETTSSTMAFILYELSKHPEIQEKARQEINDKINDHKGQLNYESLRDMEYLEMCVKESMRMHPPVGLSTRVCTKEYTLPNGYVLKPGETVSIPTLALHTDPQYFPEPLKYNPERFASDSSIRNCTFMPFGEGPRICIGMRFAILQMKFCLARILEQFKLSLNPDTKEPLVSSPKNFVNTPKNPIYFDLVKINQ